jgi:hypothetical protein
MRLRFSLGLLVVAASLALLGLEPTVRETGSAAANSTWNLEGDGVSMWCEGCCTSWPCCVLSSPCRHPYSDDPT